MPDNTSNPSNPTAIGIKGILFDTCGRLYNDDDRTIWYMLENDRAAAFEADGNVDPLCEGDYVFLYHRDLGAVAAGIVCSDIKHDRPRDAVYRDIKWLTPKPTRAEGLNHSLPAKRIKEIVGHNFYFPITVKKPFLTVAESELLIAALRALWLAPRQPAPHSDIAPGFGPVRLPSAK